MRITIELDRRQAHHLITLLEGEAGDRIEGGLRLTETATGAVEIEIAGDPELHDPIERATLYRAGPK